jgi:hypothetical protein
MQSASLPADFASKFWDRVNRLGTIVRPELGHCWEWTGDIFQRRGGYGRVELDGKSHRAHRASWLLHYGELPALFVCHHCDNPPCVRPEHLFLGTAADNHADMVAKGRWRPGSSPGALTSTAKLTDELVTRARADRAAGVPVPRIAKQLGVHRATVYDILSRETWRHIA